jgi:signal transduction histidine kinase
MIIPDEAQVEKPQEPFAVLFVDDEPMALEAFDMACSGHFPVYTAACAKEAVEVLARHGKQIAVCISDQRMPQTSGVDLLKETRQRYPHIVRVLTTAYADNEDTIAAVNEAEVFRYIPKPWNVALLRQELSHAMTHFLQRQREQEMMQEYRRGVLKVAERIVRELRGSMVNIGLGAEGIRRNLPVLLEVYDLAHAAGLIGVPAVSSRHRELLGWVLDNLDDELRHAKMLMDLIISQARADLSDPSQCGEFSMAACVAQALADFPFSENQRCLVWADLADDFYFYGIPLLMVHLLFHLLRNALWAVASARKGDVEIRLERGDAYNRLIVRDGGTGIAPGILPHIFDDFFTTRLDGSGIGLGFCRVVVAAMGGTIDCWSEEGVFTEFTVILPTVRRGG